MISNKKLKHDINSIFSKIETSIELLKEGLSEEEKEEVLSILGTSFKKLNTFCQLFLTYSLEENFVIEEVNIGQMLKLKGDLYFRTDKKIFLFVLEIIKDMSKGGVTAKMEKNSLILNAELNVESELDRFILKLIESVLKLIHLKISISKNIIKIEEYR